MKVKVKDRHYQFSPIFKLSSIIILALSAISVAGAVALFMFGMAWIFMGAYQGQPVSDKHITWGIVMICLGSYLILVNAFALTVTALAVNNRSARMTLLIAIVAILGIVPMIGGIVMLFTPIEVKGANHVGKKGPEQKETLIVNKPPLDDEQREAMASELRSLKLKIDQHTASENEKELFEKLLVEYREKYPKVAH